MSNATLTATVAKVRKVASKVVETTTASPAADLTFQVNSVETAAFELSREGWRLGVVEARAAHMAQIIGAIVNDRISEAYFKYGYTAVLGLKAKDEKAIEAAKADNADWSPVYVGDNLTNWPEFGPALKEYGRRFVDFGMSPKTKNLERGKFRMTEDEEKRVKAATSAWHRVTETEADKAERKARQTEAAAKKKAEKEAADKAKVSADANAEWPLGKTQNETFAFFLKVAQRMRAEHKKAAAAKVGLDTELASAIEALAAKFETKVDAYRD